MRVIGGEFRSRRLKSPPGQDVRPTPDRLRETLFDVLSPKIPGCVFVDAYAGSGAVGIEALSRGASQCILIERSRTAVAVLRENLETLKITTRARVIQGNATTYLGSLTADIVFLDPPYGMPEEYERTLSICTAPLVIAQHAIRLALPEKIGRLERYRQLRQGDNMLSFFYLVDE